MQDSLVTMSRRGLQSIIEASNTSLLVALGLHDGEMTYHRARQVYGKWFTDAVKSGRLEPVRRGEGRTGSMYFRITDIQMLKADDYNAAAVAASKYTNL